MEPDASVIEEAIAVIRGGLGKAELEFVASITAPIFWVLRDRTGNELIKNGSLFFLDAGEGIFAVTAAHVVFECLEDMKSPEFVQCMIGRDGKTAYAFRLPDHIIDAHADMDIATLRFGAEEVEFIGRTVLTGIQRAWPPTLAELDGGVTYCGFPGRGRKWIARREISFGRVPMAGIVTNVHESCISIQIDRDKLVRVFGDEDMPENFDFGGMSGGPVLAIVQTPTLRFWKPAGVIFQGPNPSGRPEESIPGLEIIRVRPMHFIKPNGSLEIARWNAANPL